MHLRRQQSNVATQGGTNLPLINYRTCGSLPLKLQFAHHEVRNGGFEGGGDQCANVYRGRFAKVDALRVDQDDLPRCGDATQNLAGVGVIDPVKRCRLGIGLLKIDLPLRANVEASPVDDCPLAGLVDVEGVT